MYVGSQRVATDGTVKTVTALTVPPKATGVEIQADTQNVRYTMDNATAPSTTSGMVFVALAVPKQFTIDDLLRIKFTQDAGGAGALNFHYFAGRDV